MVGTAFSAGADRPQHREPDRIGLLPSEQIGGQGDRQEHVVQVVRDAPGKRADALEPLGTTQLSLDVTPLGHVGVPGEDGGRLTGIVPNERPPDLDHDLVTRTRPLYQLARPRTVPQRAPCGVVEDRWIVVEQVADRPSDDRLGLPPVHPGRALVPVPDGVVEVADQDRVAREVEQPRLFLQCATSPDLLGHVGHAADHADPDAVLVAQDVATVDHPDLASVPVAVAVLAGPGTSAGRDGPLDVGDDPVDVVGMDPLDPRTDRRWDRLEVVPEQSGEAFAPPQVVRPQIPVPERVVRGVGEEVEPLLALAQRRVRPLEFLTTADDVELRPVGCSGGGCRIGLAVGRAQRDELGHVDDVVVDQGDAAVVVDHRRIDDTPEPRFESTALGVGPLDVVPLHRHRVGPPRRQDAMERGTQGLGPVGVLTVAIVGEHLEHVPTDDLVPNGQRGCEIRVGGVDDAQIRVDEEDRDRSAAEQVVARAACVACSHGRSPPSGRCTRRRPGSSLPS